MGGRWKAPCQSSGRAGKQASEGEGGRENTAFPGEGAAVVAASLAALPGGILQRRGGRGKEGAVLHRRPFPVREKAVGSGYSPVRLSPVCLCPPTPAAHTHSAAGALSGESGERRVGASGAVAGCLYVSDRGCGGGEPAEGDRQLPPLSRGRASLVCVNGGGGGTPQLSPGLGNFLRLRGAS